MPVRINCPSCQASLSMPQSMYGKAVRCPKCQSPFQCPSGPAEAAPAPARRTSASAAAASSGNPFAFEEAAGVEEGYAQDSRQPSRRGRRGGAWGAVNSGFLFLFLSTLCFFLCFSMLVLLPILLKKDRPTEPPSKTAQRIQDGIFVLLLMGGLVLAILGQVRCCAVPGVSGAKSTITIATVFMILATVVGLLVSFLIMKKAFTEPPKSMEEIESLRSFQKLYMLSRIILAATLLASFILSVFFILLTAQHLQDKTLVGNTMAYAVVVVTSPLLVAGLLFFYLAAAEGERRARGMEGNPSGEGFFKYLPFLVLLVSAAWFALLLLLLKGDVSKAADRAGS